MISVIVPALNEEDYLPFTLKSLSSAVDHGLVKEVIVVDGGSKDATREVADHFPYVQVVKSPKGRATQLNYGAQVATGKYLFFLHADTLIDPSALRSIMEVFEDHKILSGALKFGVDAEGRFPRLMEWMVDLRTRWLGLPYGDQGLFVRRCVFKALGGFQALPVFEDADLVMRLRKRGRMAYLNDLALTSNRAWQKRALPATTLNTLFMIGFSLGIPPKYLAPLYPTNNSWIFPARAERHQPPASSQTDTDNYPESETEEPERAVA